jgi:hypothetical protein
MIKIISASAIATLLLGAWTLAPRSTAGIKTDRLDIAERAPGCSHDAWYNYESACGYGVQWPSRGVEEGSN